MDTYCNLNLENCAGKFVKLVDSANKVLANYLGNLPFIHTVQEK